jgi:DNA-binding PadR family transcriptional regulator
LDLSIEKLQQEFLPLSESSYYILLTLTKPLHGYGMMQEIEKLSNGTVPIGPGTLYGALSAMEKSKLIEMVREKGRRKEYLLTNKGATVLLEQIHRLETMLKNGKNQKNNIMSILNEKENNNV